jgi:hypothetical protein
MKRARERERVREKEVRETSSSFSFHPYGVFIIACLAHYNEV